MLYRKKNEKYFICCKGGSRSKYAHSIGTNRMNCGENIKPVLYEMPRQFVEKYGTKNEYKRFFGGISEGENIQASAKIKNADHQKSDAMQGRT